MKGIKIIFGQLEGFWWTAITSKNILQPDDAVVSFVLFDLNIFFVGLLYVDSQIIITPLNYDNLNHFMSICFYFATKHLIGYSFSLTVTQYGYI